MSLTSRFGFPTRFYRRVIAPILLLIWVGFVIWGTRSAAVAHLAYFQESYPGLDRWLLLLSAGLASVSILYAWLIRSRMWKYEPVILLAGVTVPTLLIRPWAAIVVATILVAAFAVGSLVLSYIRLSPRRGLESLAFAPIFGLGMFSVVLFGLGLLDLFNQPIFVALLGLALILGRHHIRMGAQDAALVWTRWKRQTALSHPRVGIWVFFGFLFVGCVLAGTLAPPVAIDAVLFHMPLVKTYALGVGLIEYPLLPDGAYWYHPQNFEVLLALAQLLGGTSAAQMLSTAFWGYTLLIAVAICRLCRFPVVAIVLGAAAAMSMPVVVWSGAVIKNDLAMACFQLAALYAGLRANKGRQRGWLLVSALLLGISFGVKPTAAFAAVPIGLMWVDGCLRRTDRVRSLVLVGLCFAFTASLWPVRTYALTGTPFYGVSPSRALDALDASDPNSLLNNVGRYIDITIQAHISGGDGLYEGPIQSPIGLIPALLAGAVLMWSRRRFNLPTRWVRVVGFGALFYWMSTMRTLRYGITPVVLLPFLLAPAFARALRLMRPGGEWALTMVIVYGFLFSLAPTLIISNSRPQLLNLAGLLSDDDYISTSFSEYPTMRALDGLVSQADDVLLIGSCLIGYAPYPWKVSCCSMRTCSPERRSEKIAEGSYEYVIMPSSESASTLGDDWSLLVAPHGASTAIYSNTSVQQQ